MNFLSVKYNHGINEYGKDYTFTELTPFGDLRYYGLQAKAGNIDGGNRSKVDEIISQIEDAFSMPFYDLNSKEEKYISILIIAISDKYSANAKQKIINKIPKGIIGSTYFLDKENIEELIEKFWYINGNNEFKDFFINTIYVELTYPNTYKISIGTLFLLLYIIVMLLYWNLHRSAKLDYASIGIIVALVVGLPGITTITKTNILNAYTLIMALYLLLLLGPILCLIKQVKE